MRNKNLPLTTTVEDIWPHNITMASNSKAVDWLYEVMGSFMERWFVVYSVNEPWSTYHFRVEADLMWFKLRWN